MLPDSTNSSGVHRLKDIFERSVIFGNIGAPVDEDHEVSYGPVQWAHMRPRLDVFYSIQKSFVVSNGVSLSGVEYTERRAG
jgi:hypothetical protein